MNGLPARKHDVESLVDAYRAALLAAGMFAEKPVTSTARTFFGEIGAQGWAVLSLAEQGYRTIRSSRVARMTARAGAGAKWRRSPGRSATAVTIGMGVDSAYAAELSAATLA